MISETIIVTCDFCGKKEQVPEGKRAEIVRYTIKVEDVKGINGSNFDVCGECFEKIRELRRPYVESFLKD
jgi:hypothetical protein